MSGQQAASLYLYPTAVPSFFHGSTCTYVPGRYMGPVEPATSQTLIFTQTHMTVSEDLMLVNNNGKLAP